MLIVKSRVPVLLVLVSVAWTVNVNEPAVFGVPVIAPLSSIPKELGKEPAEIDQVQAHGVLPGSTVALRFPEYADNASPSGSDPEIVICPDAAAANASISTNAPVRPCH